MSEDKKTSVQKKYATASHPMLEAVINQLLRLKSEEQALQWLEMFEQQFIISRYQTREFPDQKSLILWIKDYDVSAEQKKEGYTGNFASITYKKLDGKWTLYATMIPVELGHHPHKQYRNDQKHPNWGHPLLREIKKKLSYATIEQVQSIFDRLHEAYPMASIPGKNKLHLMIFSRAKDREKPIEKYTFEIKIAPVGGFYIDMQLSKAAKPAVEPKEPASEMPVGAFATKVELKRKRSSKFTRATPDTPVGEFTTKVQLRRNKKR